MHEKEADPCRRHQHYFGKPKGRSLAGLTPFIAHPAFPTPRPLHQGRIKVGGGRSVRRTTGPGGKV